MVKLIPDITVKNNEGNFNVIIDAKYKDLQQDFNYNESSITICNSDIYQMLAYAVRYNCDNIQLIYPQYYNRGPITAGIAIPNDASIALHEKLGFEKTGQLKEVGFKAGRWIDVGYWQLII